MKKNINLLFLASLVPFLIITSSYTSAVSFRGGGGGDRGVRDNINDRNFGNYDNRYGDYGGYGGGVVYPYGYPVGGYLLPGPVNPGEDEANAIFRADEHPPK